MSFIPQLRWKPVLGSGGTTTSPQIRKQTGLLFWALAIKNVWTESCQLRLRPAEIHLEPESAQGQAASSEGASPSTNKIELHEETVMNSSWACDIITWNKCVFFFFLFAVYSVKPFIENGNGEGDRFGLNRLWVSTQISIVPRNEENSGAWNIKKVWIIVICIRLAVRLPELLLKRQPSAQPAHTHGPVVPSLQRLTFKSLRWAHARWWDAVWFSVRERKKS